MQRNRWTLAFLVLAFGTVTARADLPAEQLQMLLDPGGWQYISISDPDSGIKTEHTCFDGQPHPDTCSGTLTLHEDKTFDQKTFIHHQTVARHGNYQLNDNQLTFFDEYGTQDGPYGIAVDTAQKSLTIDMPQVHVQLMLEKEYRKRAKGN